MTLNTMENCKVVLTEHDEAKLGGELAKLNIEYGKLDEERKEAAKAAADELKGLDEHIMRISRTLRDGYEYRGVPCTVELNRPKAGWATVTRSDNGATFEREMTSAERQPSLFPDEKKAEKQGPVLTQIEGGAAYHCSKCERAYNPDSLAASVAKALCGRCNIPDAISADDVRASEISKAKDVLELLEGTKKQFRSDGTHIKLPKARKWACGAAMTDEGAYSDELPSEHNACHRCISGAVTFLANAEQSKPRDRGPDDPDVTPFGVACDEP